MQVPVVMIGPIESARYHRMAGGIAGQPVIAYLESDMASTCMAFARSVPSLWLGLFIAVLIVAGPATADEPVAAPPSITVPPGFTIERVAAPPLVERPIMGGFDERGRLYLAESAGRNLNFEELQQELPNSIRRLEDADGDGVFDASTVFADKLTFPQGALWHDGALFVCAPPYLWRLEDTNDDGVADVRTPLVGTFGSNGNAADIHGPFFGPDGRIYWCDGRHGHEFPDANGRPGSKGLAARVFSCRPDGSDVETFCGGGMDNPVEIAFTDDGDMLGVMTFYNPDEARHDALVHFVWGGVYPKKHNCTSEFKRTGELMPAVSIFGVVAPAGLTRYRGTAFGAEYTDNLFGCHFNTHKIVRHVLTRDRSTFTSVDEDFLVSDSPDFHPTDVLEDADGSLLVIDTGGWFRIGCPTSQIAKPDILGGVYRVRRTSEPPNKEPRGLRMPWGEAATKEELVARLSDARFAVRDRAVAELARHGDAAVLQLSATLAPLPMGFEFTPLDACAIVSALGQIGTPAAMQALRDRIEIADAAARKAIVRQLGTARDSQATRPLVEIMESGGEPSLLREAATALGRIGDRQAVPTLLRALASSSNDRFLEHSIIYALIEINDPVATAAGLGDPLSHVRRGTLIALDQMDAGNLTRDQVTPLLDTGDADLQQAVLEVIGKRPGWSEEIVGLLAQWLTDPQATPERPAMVRGALLAFRNEAAVQALVAVTLAQPTTSTATRVLLLEAIARSELDPLPAGWTAGLNAALESADADVLRQAIEAAAATRAVGCDDLLAVIGADAVRPIELRTAAVAALAGHGRPLETHAFELLIVQLAEERPPVERLAAANALSQAALSNAQLTELHDAVALASPLELRALVRAYERTNDSEVGRGLVEALGASPGLVSLTAGGLARTLQGYPADVRTAAEPLLARLTVDLAAQRERLAVFEGRLADGDAARGKEVFLGKKAACSACHRVTGQGGNIGPDLSKIGEVRNARDLLEALLYPSASFARGYETVQIETSDGRQVSGVIGRESPEAIYLRTADRSEIRIARTAIDEIAPSPLSVMPQGLEKTMSPDELRDLVAYLRGLR